MLNRNSFFILTASTILLAFSALPEAAYAGFRSTDLSIRGDLQSKAQSSKRDLYTVRDRGNRNNRGDRRHRKHKHSRRHSRRNSGFFFYPPYYPYYGPAWGYPPYGYYYYDRRPRSGITFYFSN